MFCLFSYHIPTTLNVCVEIFIYRFSHHSLTLFSDRIVTTSAAKMSELIVDTEYGKVQGIKKISALNTAYNAFLGIRYATPPVGDLRFKVGK